MKTCQTCGLPGEIATTWEIEFLFAQWRCSNGHIWHTVSIYDEDAGVYTHRLATHNQGLIFYAPGINA